MTGKDDSGLPRRLLREKPEWRSWLASFPKTPAPGYVPARLYLDDVTDYLGAWPSEPLSDAEVGDMRAHFVQMFKPAADRIQKSNAKIWIGYLSTGIPIMADVLLVPGTSQLINGIAFLLFGTSAAADWANNREKNRLDACEAVVKQWLDQL